MFGHQTQADAIAAWNTRADLIPDPHDIAAQALARAEAAETALEAEGPWVVETPNLEEYGHAIARVALEKAERAARSYGDNSYAAQMIGDAILALANDPAALAEIVKGVNG